MNKDQWIAEHKDLRADFEAYLARSCGSNAEFVTNALLEWDAGQTLIRRAVAHLDAKPLPARSATASGK